MSRTLWRGRWTCQCVIANVEQVLEPRLIEAGVIKNSLDIFQAGYNAGGVAASAGTHDGGGVLDTAQFSTAALRIKRECGWWAWHRTPAQGFMHHSHDVLGYCPHVSWGAQHQINEGRAGRNGLAGRGRDDGPQVKVATSLAAAKATMKSTPSPKPTPTPETPKDWLSMATEADVRKIVREENKRLKVTRSPNAPATVYKGKKSVLPTSALARVWSVSEAILKGVRARVRRSSHLPDDIYKGQKDFSVPQAINRSWTVSEATLKEVREIRALIEEQAKRDGLPVANLLATVRPFMSPEVEDDEPVDAANDEEKEEVDE